MRVFVSAFLTIAALVGLSGCAAMQKTTYDGTAPAKVCPSTLEGGEPKTFCY